MSSILMKEMAGAPGFEPGNAGTKNRCLTAWRRPNEPPYLHKALGGCNTNSANHFAVMIFFSLRRETDHMLKNIIVNPEHYLIFFR